MDLPAAGFFLPITDGDGYLSGSPRLGISAGLIDAIWRYLHGGHHAVSVCHAFEHQSDLQPDAVGQHLQSVDVEHYVSNCADIFAYCVALHCVELLQNVGAHDN